MIENSIRNCQDHDCYFAGDLKKGIQIINFNFECELCLRFFNQKHDIIHGATVVVYKDCQSIGQSACDKNDDVFGPEKLSIIGCEELTNKDISMLATEYARIKALTIKCDTQMVNFMQYFTQLRYLEINSTFNREKLATLCNALNENKKLKCLKLVSTNRCILSDVLDVIPTTNISKLWCMGRFMDVDAESLKSGLEKCKKLSLLGMGIFHNETELEMIANAIPPKINHLVVRLKDCDNNNDTMWVDKIHAQKIDLIIDSTNGFDDKYLERQDDKVTVWSHVPNQLI